MSGFSGGSFSFSRGGRKQGVFGRRSHSSGHRGGFLGGVVGGHSHSSGHRGRYAGGGHYRQTRRRGGLGCLGAFLVGAALAGGSVLGLISLLA